MMTFTITDEEEARFEEWKSKHEEVWTTIGDRYSFTFSPTSIGTFISVYDPVTKEEFHISNLDNF